MALNNECVDNPIEIRDYSWIDEDGKIDEIAFCKAYVSSHPVKCVNDIFYGMDGVVFVMLLISMLMGMYFRTKNEEMKELDAVSSICFGDEMTLIVVANRDEITDEDEFAELLLEKYKENSFKTVRLSTDLEQPETVRMKVYLREKDFEEGEKPKIVVIYER